MKRVFLIVLDSCGIGQMPDSESFGDVGVNTLASCATSPKLNIPNMIANITSAFSAKNINIENMVNKSRGDYACTILDVQSIDDAAVEEFKAVDGIIKVRVIK